MPAAEATPATARAVRSLETIVWCLKIVIRSRPECLEKTVVWSVGSFERKDADKNVYKQA